jgi:hypothetical protein
MLRRAAGGDGRVAKRTSGLETRILELEVELGELAEAHDTLQQTHTDTLTRVRASLSLSPFHHRTAAARVAPVQCIPAVGMEKSSPLKLPSSRGGGRERRDQVGVVR